MMNDDDEDIDASETSVLPSLRYASTVSFRLLVARGPETGASVALNAASPGPQFIGHSVACHLRISDPATSRRHASVDVENNVLRLRDLGSTNGTFVNGTRIVEALLFGGEEVRLGGTIVRVEVDHNSPAVVLSEDSSFGQVIGESVAMRRLYPICQRLAQSQVPLVIEGETGTGKEALAHSIHSASPRSRGPFVVFDCTAVHPSLIESALFGHERGAFTGAVAASTGVFEEAAGGTLFIDEIGDLEKSMQAKLLRAIQSLEVRRVGGSKWIKLDVRILAATRRNLDAEVQAGRFRDDLFFRLAIARITLPPLRQRQKDIEILARHFWSTHPDPKAPLDAATLERFASYDWPGNVRELANTVARLVALGDFAQSYASLFMHDSAAALGDETGDLFSTIIGKRLPFTEARDLVMREFERRYMDTLLADHAGDVQGAVAASGIGERYLRMLRAKIRDAALDKK